MTNLHTRSVSQIFDAARDYATPGGGAVCALCGYLGVSLILKAIRVSARGSPDAAMLADLSRTLSAAADRLAWMADRDSSSFQEYLDAAKMPRGTAAERAARKASLAAAAENAGSAALNLLQLGTELLAETERVRAEIAPTIMADVNAGTGLLKVMCAVAAENVEANLAGIADVDTRAAMKARSGALLQGAALQRI